jgi:hypothetical protein
MAGFYLIGLTGANFGECRLPFVSGCSSDFVMMDCMAAISFQSVTIKTETDLGHQVFRIKKELL